MWWFVVITFVIMIWLFASAAKNITKIQDKNKQSKHLRDVPDKSKNSKNPAGTVANRSEGKELKESSIWPGRDIRLELEGRSIIEWLQEHGPDPALWHFIALFTVCDGRNLELYKWLADQDELDTASAAHLFHVLEGWMVLHENSIDNEPPWERAKFPIIKTLFEKLSAEKYSGPKFTLLHLDDNVSESGYEHEYTMYRHNHGKEPPTMPPSIFDYAEREIIHLKHHYSDYHYNPYGTRTAKVIKLEGPFLRILEMY